MDIIRNFEAAATLMSSDPNSQLALVSKRQHIKLSPKYLGNIRTGISCHMTCALARYTNELEGAPVAFKNVKVVQRMGRIIADQTCVHFDVDADFIVFKPSVGCTLKGKVNKVTKEHIGCLVHGCFNAWMPHSCLTQKKALDILLGSELEFTVESINTHNVMSVKGKFGKLIPKPGVKPDEPEIEVKKTRKKKKNKKEQPDCVSVDNETGLGEETILAGAGTNIEIGLDSSGLEPVFSSTQVEGGEVTQLGKKAKKHKKKNRETDDSVNELTTSSGFNSVLDGASTSDSLMKKSESDCNEVIHKKKKKKHSRSELSFENGLSHEESVNVSDMNDGVFQASYSANKKNRKRKHSESVQNNGRCEANKTSSLEDSAEVLYPKKKHKKNKKTDPDRDPSSNLTSIENQDETQEQSMHSKNKKHKKGQK